MMSEASAVEETNNGEYEIVDKNQEVGIGSNLPAPSALPAFATLPSAPHPVPPISSGTSGATNPFSIKASGGTSLPAQVNVPPPVTMTAPMFPSTAPTATYNQPPVPSEGVGLEMPLEGLNVSSGQPTESPLSSSYGTQQEQNFFGWLKGTVAGSDILSKVAEKAKTSMDTMITTLDPQMKDFMHSRSGFELRIFGFKLFPHSFESRGAVEIAVASDKEPKIIGIKEGFQRQFANVIVRGLGSPGSATSSGVALQPVGYENGKKAAFERIANLRQSGLVSHQTTIAAVENFVVEMSPNSWFDIGLILLDDPAMEKKLEILTQALPIPDQAIACMKSHTPTDYRWKESGFAITVGQAVAESFGVTPTEWHNWIGGTPRTELVRNAATSLAYMYKFQKPTDYATVPVQQ